MHYKLACWNNHLGKADQCIQAKCNRHSSKTETVWIYRHLQRTCSLITPQSSDKSHRMKLHLKCMKPTSLNKRFSSARTSATLGKKKTNNIFKYIYIHCFIFLQNDQQRFTWQNRKAVLLPRNAQFLLSCQQPSERRRRTALENRRKTSLLKERTDPAKGRLLRCECRHGIYEWQ